MGISTVQLCYDDGVSSGQVCQSAVSLVQEQPIELTSNLAAWWALEEASGTRFNSHQTASPASFHMTEGASAGNTTGKINNAWHPGGNSPAGAFLYIDESASSPMPDIMTAASMSVCLWVNFDFIIDPPSTSGLQYLFNRADLTTLVSGEFTIYLNRNSAVSPQQMEIDLITYGPGRNELTRYDSVIPSVGNWYFVYAYYDNATGDQGISVNDGTVATGNDASPVPGAEGVIQLGQFKNNASFYRRLNGKLDEVAVWTNRVLTAAEVTWLYNSGAGRSYADL